MRHPNTSRCFTVLGWAAIALCAGVHPAAADTCASSVIQMPSRSPITTSAATFDTSSSSSGVLLGQAAFDIPQGSVHVYHGGSLGSTTVTMRDYYDVSGVAPGTPVTLTVEFAFAGTVSTPGCGASGCWGDFTATITWNGQTAQVFKNVNVIADTWTSFPVSGGTSLPITFVAGTPQLIEFKLSGFRDPGGNQIEDGTGHLRFVGTDSSIQVVSCNGYGDRVTPTHASSWGSLKVRYR
jgi:hypothetical protein